MKTGRIIKLLGGFYTVKTEAGEIFETRARGNFRDKGQKPLVGDFVDFEDNYILKLHERKNSLVRPALANLDQVVVVMSTVEPDFSANLLDRFLVLLEHHNQPIIIYISKTDLQTLDMSTYTNIGYKVVTDYEELFQSLKDKVTILMGQTGVGKSTLLNKILPDQDLATGEISDKLGRGRHTTRHVELFPFGENGLIADTPGFSSLNYEVDNGPELNRCFIDLYEFSADCKFRECSHTHEPECAVKAALAEGKIAQSRYDNYLQILSEINNKRETYAKRVKKQ